MDTHDLRESWPSTSPVYLRERTTGRAKAPGEHDVQTFLDVHQGVWEEHIDEFCRLGPDAGRHTPSRRALHRLLAAHPETSSRCLLSCLSRLVGTRVAPLESAPGRMCARTIQGLLKRPSNAVARSLIARVQRRHPRAWESTIAALTRVELDSQGWSTWPSEATCQLALASIEAITPAWADAVSELQVELRTAGRWKGRNHSFRRAVRQWSMLAKVLRTVAVPRGDLRLLFEYLHCVWWQYSTDAADGSTGEGCYELLVLELLPVLTQLHDIDPQQATVPRPLEQQGPNRRQRIQRARLRLYSAWQPGPDHEWRECILPMLEALSSEQR